MTELEEATPTHHAAPVRVVAASSCAGPVPLEPPVVRAAATAAQSRSGRGWLSVGALALGAFVIVMTETLPVGLPPEIADGLNVSLGLGRLMARAGIHRRGVGAAVLARFRPL
jgi:hypothetical protein